MLTRRAYLASSAAFAVRTTPIREFPYSQVRLTEGPLSRRWRTSDTIELRLPFSTPFVPIEKSAPHTLAAMRGRSC